MFPELCRFVWGGDLHGNRVARTQRSEKRSAEAGWRPACGRQLRQYGAGGFRSARGVPRSRAAPPFTGPGFGPPPGAQPPIVSNSITLVVSGINSRQAGKTFSDKLTDLAGRVSGGFQLSGSGGGGRSMYSIAICRKAIDVKAFADQITGPRSHGSRGTPLKSTHRLSERFPGTPRMRVKGIVVVSVVPDERAVRADSQDCSLRRNLISTCSRRRYERLFCWLGVRWVDQSAAGKFGMKIEQSPLNIGG